MLQNPSKNSACCGHLASKTLPFDFEYMKIMYMNCGLRNEYESGVCINEHYLSSSENEAWKKIDSSLHGFITNQQNDQLLIGLLAQLVEHWTGIAEVIGSNPVQGWIFFSRPYFYYCLSSVHYCEDRLHIHFTFCYRAFVCFVFSFPSVRRSSKQSPTFPPPLPNEKKNVWIMVILLTNCNLTPSIDVGSLYGSSLSVINIFTRRNPHLKLLPKEGKSSVSLHSQHCAPRKNTMSCGDIICQDNFLFVSKYICTVGQWGGLMVDALDF